MIIELDPAESFEVVGVDARFLLAAFRRVVELDAEEDWAFLSVSLRDL